MQNFRSKIWGGIKWAGRNILPVVMIFGLIAAAGWWQQRQDAAAERQYKVEDDLPEELVAYTVAPLAEYLGDNGATDITGADENEIWLDDYGRTNIVANDGQMKFRLGEWSCSCDLVPVGEWYILYAFPIHPDAQVGDTWTACMTKVSVETGVWLRCRFAEGEEAYLLPAELLDDLNRLVATLASRETGDETCALPGICISHTS